MRSTNLVWSVYILLAILGRIISGFGAPLLLVQYNIDRDQEKPVSTIFIRGNKITQKMCACSLLHLEMYDISSNSRSEVQWKTRWVIPMSYCEEQQHFENRLTSTIKISHPELICFCHEWICFCRERFASAVSYLLLLWQLNAFREVRSANSC